MLVSSAGRVKGGRAGRESPRYSRAMLKLYSHANKLAPNTMKLRATLAEVGAAYEFVTVDLAGGAQRHPDFLALNPHGKVPVLVDGGFALAESDAILWYLGEKFPAAELVPTDIRGRAVVHQWCDFASSALYANAYQYFTVSQGPDATRHVPWLAEQLHAALERALGVLEPLLGTHSFVAGSLSIADFAVTAALEQLRLRAPYDAARFPHVAAYHERITNRASWQAAVHDA